MELESEWIAPAGSLFDFDALDYFHTSLGESDLMDDTGPPIAGRKALEAALLLDRPETLADTAFILEIQGLGYAYSPMPQDKLGIIAELFQPKTTDDISSTECIAEYRDILVFRKRGKMQGIAKLCFACGQHWIVGSILETAYFGQDGEYSRLEHILSSVR